MDEPTETQTPGIAVGADHAFSRIFIFSAGVILALTGAAKLWSTLGSAKALDLADPITGMTFRQLFVLVGMGTSRA